MMQHWPLLGLGHGHLQSVFIKVTSIRPSSIQINDVADIQIQDPTR